METFQANVEPELVATIAEKESRASADVPFRVLLIGDWSGRANRRADASTRELKTYRPLLVDRDNLDQLIARLGVRLRIPLTDDGSQSLAVNLNQLEDFHPDRLFNRLEIFDPLRRTRSDLQNPATFAAAVRSLQEAHRADAQPDSGPAPAREKLFGGDAGHGSVLDQILAVTDGPSSKEQDVAAEASTEISRLAKAAAAPM